MSSGRAQKKRVAGFKKLLSEKKQKELRAAIKKFDGDFVSFAHEGGLLERAVLKRSWESVKVLLSFGVVPDARPGLSDGQDAKGDNKLHVYENPGALMCLVGGVKAKEAVKVDVARRLLAAGASPAILHPDLRIINPAHLRTAYSPLDIAVLERSFDLVALLLPHCDDETKASATVTMLLSTHIASVANYWYSVEEPLSFDDIRRLISLGLPCTGCSRWGLPVAHAIAMYSSLEVFSFLAPQCSDLCTARIGEASVVIQELNKFVANESMTLGPGTAPRAALHLLIAAFERRLAELVDMQREEDVVLLQANIAELQQISSHLAELGSTSTESPLAIPDELQPFFGLFCEWCGEEEVIALVRSRDISNTTPYLFASWLAGQFAGPALRGHLSHKPEHPISILLDKARCDAEPSPTEVSEWKDMFGDTEHDQTKTFLVYPEEYHEDAKELLEWSRLFAKEGEVIWGAAGSNGEGDLFCVSATETTIHGRVNSLLEDFLKD